jgi:CBS domain-containing protein
MRHTRGDPAEGPREEPTPGSDRVCVRDQMSRPAVTIATTAPLAEASRLMALNRIHYLPVVDPHARLVGIVNADDVRGTRRPERPGPETVEAVMSAPAVAIGPAAPLTEAMRLMLDRGIGALPVVEAERVVGILTQSDVVAAAARGATS